MKPFLVMAFVGWCMVLSAIDLTPALAWMDKRGVHVRQFQDKTEGSVVVARETIALDAKISPYEAQEIAVGRCEKRIMGFLEGQVLSGGQTYSLESDAKGVKGVLGQSQSEKVANDSCRVLLYSCEQTGELLTVVCYTSDRLREKMTSATVSSDNGNEYTDLQVTGMTPLGENLQQVRETALNNARREAVKLVLGSTISSMTSRNSLVMTASDENGKETTTSDERFRAKVYTSAGGFAEVRKIIREEKSNGYYTVTILARVYKNRLQQDYAPALKQLGDPNFYVDAQSPSTQEFFKGFLVDLGFKMTNSPYDADYTFHVKTQFIPAPGKENGQLPKITLEMKQKSSGEILMSVENDPSVSIVFHPGGAIPLEVVLSTVARQISVSLHEKLNETIGKMNASGRHFTLRLEGTTQFVRQEVKIIQEIVEGLGAIDNVNVSSNPMTQVTEFTFGYTGDSAVLEQTLTEAFENQIKRRKYRPRIKAIEKNRLVYNF